MVSGDSSCGCGEMYSEKKPSKAIITSLPDESTDDAGWSYGDDHSIVLALVENSLIADAHKLSTWTHIASKLPLLKKIPSDMRTHFFENVLPKISHHLATKQLKPYSIAFSKLRKQAESLNLVEEKELIIILTRIKFEGHVDFTETKSRNSIWRRRDFRHNPLLGAKAAAVLARHFGAMESVGFKQYFEKDEDYDKFMKKIYPEHHYPMKNTKSLINLSEEEDGSASDDDDDIADVTEVDQNDHQHEPRSSTHVITKRKSQDVEDIEEEEEEEEAASASDHSNISIRSDPGQSVEKDTHLPHEPSKELETSPLHDLKLKKSPHSELQDTRALRMTSSKHAVDQDTMPIKRPGQVASISKPEDETASLTVKAVHHETLGDLSEYAISCGKKLLGNLENSNKRVKMIAENFLVTSITSAHLLESELEKIRTEEETASTSFN